MVSSQSPLATHRRTEFRTRRFRLRPVRAQDQEMMFSWRTDVDTSRYLSGAAPESIEQQKAWFERVRADEAYSYHIVEDNGAAIGYVSLFNADASRAEAEWGVVMGRQRKGSDVRYLAPLCCVCAFEYGELEALYTCVNEDNTNAVRRVQQMGARLVEGTSIYRKEGELLLRIQGSEFKDTLSKLVAGNPALADELDVQIHVGGAGR